MKKKSAFSLLELIFAIVIVGVIAGVAIPKFMETKDDATVSAIKQDVNTIISAVRSYVLVKGEGTLDEMVSVSSDKWELDNTKKILSMKNDASCIKITLDTDLKVEIGDSETDVCTKLKESITSQTYTL